MPIKPESKQSLLSSARRLEWSVQILDEDLPTGHPNKQRAIGRLLRKIQLLREAAELAPDRETPKNKVGPPSKEDFVWGPWMKRGTSFQEALDIAEGRLPGPVREHSPMNLEEYLQELAVLNDTPLAQQCLTVMKKFGGSGDPINYHPTSLMVGGEASVNPEDYPAQTMDRALSLMRVSLVADGPNQDYAESLRWIRRIAWLMGPQLDIPESFERVEKAGEWLLRELASILDNT